MIHIVIFPYQKHVVSYYIFAKAIIILNILSPLAFLVSYLLPHIFEIHKNDI